MKNQRFEKLARDMEGRDGNSSSLILFSILALVISLLVWASQSEIDNVTRGEGRIISSVQNQKVQASERGVILKRFVAESTLVAEGDVLFELDPIDANSELSRLKQKLNALAIRELRLRAEIDDSPFSIDQVDPTVSNDVYQSEENLFSARKFNLEGEIFVLSQRKLQREQELIAIETTIKTAEKTVDSLIEETEIVEPLVAEKIYPATKLLELKRQLDSARGERERNVALLAQANAAIAELETEIENAKLRYRLRAIDELNVVVTEQAELLETQPLLEERVTRTVIRAPLAGIVSRLNFRTTGGFVGMGDVMLELVPTGEALIVEAKIAPKDISRISLGDEVRIRLSAYDSAKYGSVAGEVTRISADAVLNEQTGASHYLVDVAIVGDLIINEGEEPVDLLPGMTATVDVISGKRTILEYIWNPVAKVKEIALRD